MRLPRDLSGGVLVDALCRNWGYVKVNQVGSHIILQTPEPLPHRVAIPAHRALRVGTLNSILRSVANHKGVDREAILIGLGNKARRRRPLAISVAATAAPVATPAHKAMALAIGRVASG